MRIGIIGGGPAGLFLFKRLVELNPSGLEISIFERHSVVGPGMPYSHEGACPEHLTNVSANEIPPLLDSLKDWLKDQPSANLAKFGLNPQSLHSYHVVPRLLFGSYLAYEFQRFHNLAQKRCIPVTIHTDTEVRDIRPVEESKFEVLAKDYHSTFDAVVISTGHVWPRDIESQHKNYFQSPYPPAKLAVRCNFPVAIRGSSLTAIDAIKTLAYTNGRFVQKGKRLIYEVNRDSPDFELVVHSKDGFLPSVRFHVSHTYGHYKREIKSCEYDEIRAQNQGFVPLDWVFDQEFKLRFRQEDPGFYEEIQYDTMEDFVERMVQNRSLSDPFEYLADEYEEADESIRRRESIPWKERLYLLSIALNRPARYFSAEDHLRLRETLLPLIALIIASVPQGPAKELLALHRAGRIRMVAVGTDSQVMPLPQGGALYDYGDRQETFRLFVDCIGQQPQSFDAFPFPSLRTSGLLQPARVRFRKTPNPKHSDYVEVDGQAYLQLPGVAVDESYAALGPGDLPVQGLFIMAVPLISGFHPDYSGLDFCDEAAKRIAARLVQQ